MAALLKNAVKEMMKEGKPALGMIARLGRSGDIARIAKTTGHDFVFVDGQHALYSVETIGHIAQAALGCGVVPMARVRSCDDPDTQVLLDNGVMGIVLPGYQHRGGSKARGQSRQVSAVGRRSVSRQLHDVRFPPGVYRRRGRHAQRNTLVVCMVETQEGLDNVDAIAAVDGVDVIHVGSNDLMTPLGKPGQYGTPEHIAALDKIFAAAKKHGKFAGVGGDRNVERQAEFIRKGARFLTTNSDIAFMPAEASRVTGELRKALGA